MAFTGNGPENIRLATQAVTLIINWAAAMRNNADTHIAWANSSAANPQDPNSLTVAALRDVVNDSAANYQNFLLKLNAAITVDPTKTKMIDGLARINCTAAEVTTPGNAMYAASVTLGNAAKTTFAEIIAACTTFKAAIPQPASVWPE